MADELAAARELLAGVRLEVVDRLAGNDRSTVHRVRASGPQDQERSLIVKEYFAPGEGWAREAAALTVLTAAGRQPQLVAQGASPPVLVMADLGSGPCVADASLSDDPASAEAALCDWARAMAALHVASRDARAAFRAELAARQGELPIAESRVGADLDDAVRVLDRECAALGVRLPVGALDELRGLAKRFGGSGPAALTPADACPDNNISTAAGLVLIDFEGAEWRHVVWDVAYLRVPWPSCWCAWRLPDDVSDRAVAAYRAAAAGEVPEVAEAGFERDLAAATTGWAVLSTTWFLGNALGDDPPLNPHRPTPTRRAMIQHRLERAGASPELPAVAELARRLGAQLRERWGDVPLAMAPAFRSGQ